MYNDCLQFIFRDTSKDIIKLTNKIIKQWIILCVRKLYDYSSKKAS